MKRVLTSVVCSVMTGAYAAAPAPVVCAADDLSCVLQAVSAGRAWVITPLTPPEKARRVSRLQPKNETEDTGDTDGDGVLGIDDVSTPDPNDAPEDAAPNPFADQTEPVDLDSNPADDLTGDAAVAIDNKGPIDGVYECHVSLPFPPIVKTYVSINGKKDGMTVFLQAEINRSGNNFFGYGLGSVTRDSDNVFTYTGTTSAGQQVSFMAYKSTRTERVTLEGGVTLGVKSATQSDPIQASYECSKIF